MAQDPAAAPAAEEKVSGKVLMVVSQANELKDKTGKTIAQTGWYLPEVAHPYKVFSEAGYTMEFASINGGDAEMDFSSYEIYTSKQPDKVCQDFVQLMRASDPNEKDISSDKGVATIKATIGRDETGDAKDRKINKLAITTSSFTALQGKESNYDIIFFAGGHGTCYDFYDSNPKHDIAAKKDTRHMHAFAAKIYENKDKPGIVAAVCHGVNALIDLKLSDGTVLVKDKNVTGFTNEEEKAAGMTDTIPVSTEDGLKGCGAKYIGKANWTDHSIVDNGVVTGQNPASGGSAAKLALEELAKRRKK